MQNRLIKRAGEEHIGMRFSRRKSKQIYIYLQQIPFVERTADQYIHRQYSHTFAFLFHTGDY